MKQMRKFRMVIPALLLLLPVFLFASGNTGNYQLSWSSQVAEIGQQLNMKWTSSTASEEEVMSLSWNSGTELPAALQQIKNVKAGIDLDQDGKKEFMFPMVYLNSADEKKRAVYVYEAVGNDDYAMVWSYEFPGMGDQFTTVDVSDLDGDGNEEILAVHVPEEGDNGPNLYVFEWDGTDNGYGTAPTVTWDLGSTDARDVVRVAKAADLDGDGKQEVVITSFGTQPAIVIASVNGFEGIPVWTSEYVNNEVGGTAPDIAAIGIGNMDTNGRPEVILTEGASDQLLIIEWSGTQYNMNAIALPAGKSVSVHGVDVGDADGDGRDEAYIANLQGNVYVLSGEGDAITFTASDLYTIAETEEQWLEASVGSFSGRGLEFVIAASNASKAMSFQFTGDDVTNPESYTAITVIDEEDFFNIVPGGIRVYGLDMADDMDGDGIAELVFTRGSTRGGDGAPGVFIAEFEPLVTAPGLPEKLQQIKNVKAGIDLDQDGKKEFMFPMVYLNSADEKKRAVYVYEAVGNDDYAMVWSYEFPGMGDQFTTVDVSDLDGDGNEEILAVHVPEEGDNGPNLYVFEWDGTDNGYGTAPTVTWDLGSTDARDVVRVAKAADLDGDGKQEVVITSFGTQPAIVIASVNGFEGIPVWTSEYVNNEVGGTAPDIAAIGIGNMDTNGRPEVILTEGASDQLLIIEWSGTQYNMNAIALPAGKSVSVHGVDVGDADGDGRDEAYIANLQGNVYVLSGEGDAITFTASDLYTIAETEEQWLEASVGSFSGRGLEFVIAASNASKAMSFQFTGDDVTNPESYTAITVIDEEDFFNIVPGGIRVYGLDMADDMDGDGIAELVFTRGSTRGGDGAPGVFIAEFEPLVTAPGLPEKLQQIKNVKAGIDLDQDGKKEFMFPMVYLNSADEKKRAVYVYEAVGNDDYAMVWSYEFPGMGDQFTTVDVSDLDGDGNEEILAVHVPEEGDNGPNLYVFEWDGTDNGYGTAPTVTWDLGSTDARDVVRVAKAADLDGDGKQEVVITSFGTQPAIVIASVNGFEGIPVWTSEYVNNEVGGTAPDIAAIGIGNMDTNGRPEVILTEGASDQLLIIEWSGTQYNMNAIALPAGKSVSVHGVDVGDADGDGRDEAYIANLQGNVYVLSGEGDAITFTASDLYTIAETEEQWLEASVGSFSGRGLEFVIAASNASKAMSFQFTGDDVTNPESYTAITVIDEEDFFNIVPGGIRVYGLDMADDMDGDGIAELVFTRGSTRGGDGAPGVFIVENFNPYVGVDELTSGIPDEFKLLQNYPNPFNPTTQINYSVSRPGKVNISVFNVLGQKVCTLVDGYHNVNYYTVQWNATNDNGFQVPSGIYFYRMETNEASLMKRMLLMR